MALNIKIADTGNSALDGPQALHEYDKMLKVIIEKMNAGQTDGVIYDSNGRKSGSWEVSIPEAVFTIEDVELEEETATITMFCEGTGDKRIFEIEKCDINGMELEPAKEFVLDSVDVKTDFSIVGSGSTGHQGLIDWIKESI